MNNKILQCKWIFSNEKVCVCVCGTCTCLCVYSCPYAHVWRHRSASDIPLYGSTVLAYSLSRGTHTYHSSHVEVSPFTSWGRASSVVSLPLCNSKKLTSNSLVSAVHLVIEVLGLQMCGFWELNSDPQTCMVSPSPHWVISPIAVFIHSLIFISLRFVFRQGLPPIG